MFVPGKQLHKNIATQKNVIRIETVTVKYVICLFDHTNMHNTSKEDYNTK